MAAEPVGTTRVNLWLRVALVAGAVGLAALGASFRTHSWPSTITVLISTVVLLVLAIRRPPASLGHTPRLRRGLILWSVLLAAALAWEAYAFVRQPDWSRPSYDHPTISTLLDPILEQGPLRIVGWLVWLGAGWRLVTR
ncbi:MAG TPA: hypothetical protein VGX25_15640 [Actinophytocola sp.]|uniref:hypothetical protein n=1 Tax=Actinophytocola sp. TaxID=1872138 RepID=UPI002DDCB324|nr:hypothetical protein [Actinophytocola sp.]HEV2780817.1 hypothetical protein [Actinophytocola sp.]